MSKCVAIITARGGSKRIPGKNIRDFCGQPIIKYSIEAALCSDLFNEVMVSTDDMEIAEISKNFGAKIPFMRSKKTSDDYATTADVIEEVLLEYQKLGQNFDYACCIYPTTPFITSKKLKNAFDNLINTDADSLIPVVKFGYPIQRALKIENNKVKLLFPENINKRSQDLEQTYHDCGQFYFLKTETFLKDKSLFTENTAFLEIPESEVQDIDIEEDWKIAELKFVKLNYDD